MDPTNQVALEVQGLARRFGRRWALAHVSFTVTAGQSLLLVGPNGSGKTTLLRCIASALRPHEGRILMNGKELWRDRRTLRRSIALLSHSNCLYDDLSARQNLEVWSRMGGISSDITSILDRVGLPHNRIDPIRTFSAGMRRRLALGRLLLKSPSIVLLDEPFSALDPDGRTLVRTLVSEMRDRGTTLIIATHLTEEAHSLCDSALRLESGRVAWSGAPNDLLGARP